MTNVNPGSGNRDCVPYTADELEVVAHLLPGNGAAIPIRELQSLTRLTAREIKGAVEGLRLRHRLRIGSSRGKAPGYYIIETLPEEDATFRTLIRQAIQMLRVANSLRDRHRILEALGQLELELQ